MSNHLIEAIRMPIDIDDAMVDMQATLLQVERGWALGPLRTQAKIHDHEIVRAWKKCPKAVPRHFQNYCSAVTNPQV
jgi:hypothetical protein